MPGAEPPSTTIAERPELPWRIVAGAFLHFALPAYLLVGLAGGAAGLLAGLTLPALAAHALAYSAGFALSYPLLAVVATAAAALLDPLLRRRRRWRGLRDPHAAASRSRRDLAAGLAAGRSRLDRDAVAMLDAIAALPWNHDEPAFQSLSADLGQVVGTAIAALATTTPVRRQELGAITTAALARIAAALRDLQDERARLDEGDLRTVARYVDGRYPPADCAGDSSN